MGLIVQSVLVNSAILINSTIFGTYRIQCIVALGLLAMLFTGDALAQKDSDQNGQAAVVVDVSGTVWLTRYQASSRISLTSGETINSGDLVSTSSNGKVALLLADETLLRLYHNSEFRLNAVAPVAGWLTAARQLLTSSYQLIQGELWFRNKRRESDIEITTSHISVSVRGTEFSIVANQEQTLVNMLEGEVNASNSYGSVNAQSGEQIIGQFGKAPFKRVLLKPDNAVQWAIRVPDIFSTNSLFANYLQNNNQGIDQNGYFDRALSMAQKGEYAHSIKLLNEHKNKRDIRTIKRDVELLEAWAFFESGKISHSYQMFERFCQNYKSDLRGWQLLALSALVNNHNNGALEASNTTIQLSANNAESWLLRSYILQSKFELEAAADAAAQAVKHDAGLVAGWLQRSALAVANTQYHKARRFALKAESISVQPLADVQSTLGFIALAEGKRERAGRYFSNALSINTGFAPAHLGKALVAMHVNDSRTALKSIATAVSIEPLNAGYMNYYARIAYETGRLERAVEMLERASELDPNDPTPYYLRALIARDDNQDGEAVQLLGQASRLNDNRAVYRSRYLLDADLAIKNVDLSLAFERFDFLPWAERRAVEALQLDRQNFSAHLMYANTLNNVPGREGSFAAETLLARLLQPVNANAFNIASDRTVLFEQSRLTGVASYTLGSFDNINREVTVFGNLPASNTAFQANVQNAESDGWRPTQNESARSVAVIGKWQPTLNHGFYISGLRENLGEADEQLSRFEYSSPSEPRDNRKFHIARIELGHNYKVSSKSLGLNFLSYEKNDLDFIDASVIETQSGLSKIVRDTINSIDFSSETIIAQSQYMTNFDDHDFIAGLLFRDSTLHRIDDAAGDISVFNPSGDLITMIENTLAPLLNIDNKVSSRYLSAYMIDRWHVSDAWFAEGALYWDYFQNAQALTGDEWQDTQLSGRLGLSTDIGSYQAVRMAAYRYILPTSALPRIDPIDVVGLGVYRHDIPGSFTDEVSVSWEVEWHRGYLQLHGFYSEIEVEDRTRFSTNSNELLTAQTIQQMRYRGVEVRFNNFLTKNIGVSLGWDHTKIDDDLEGLNSREEDLGNMSANFVYGNGISFRVEQIYRKLHYMNRTQDNELSLTNVGFDFEFPKNLGALRLEVNNIEDNNFDWVTDRFVIDGRIPRRQYLATLELYLQ